jgi:alkyl sulfatase BDS1-like metallo-beta-lactamase superfamily hydrolase
LYRVQTDDQVSVFLITGEGIILADPLTLGVANQLRRELVNRFPNQPVRYVVYTSRRFDRAEGH